jgi:hypothetical protein
MCVEELSIFTTETIALRVHDNVVVTVSFKTHINTQTHTHTHTPDTHRDTHFTWSDGRVPPTKFAAAGLLLTAQYPSPYGLALASLPVPVFFSSVCEVVAARNKVGELVSSRESSFWDSNLSGGDSPNRLPEVLTLILLL